VRPEDILRFLRARPFEPFRIYMSDGTMFDIPYPGLALVDQSKVVVGVPGPRGPDGPVERTVFCALVHITRAEKVNGSVAR
jgi:hypothetical protein